MEVVIEASEVVTEASEVVTEASEVVTEVFPVLASMVFKGISSCAVTREEARRRPAKRRRMRGAAVKRMIGFANKGDGLR